jgi:putative ATP-dependent endonuclease of OLD family
LKSWFGDNDISIAALLAKTEADKIKKYIRLAYQTPEDGSAHCARSYEDALILANLDRFGIVDDADAATSAWEEAQGFGKTEEAIRYAITEADWTVPKYITQGLLWLADPPPPPEEPPPLVPEAIDAVPAEPAASAETGAETV